MTYDIEQILRILFLILSIIWASRIMVLRSDKQIIINPILIIISSLLVFTNDFSDDFNFIGMEISTIRISLYCIYIAFILFGLYTTNKNDSLF